MAQKDKLDRPLVDRGYARPASRCENQMVVAARAAAVQQQKDHTYRTHEAAASITEMKTCTSNRQAAYAMHKHVGARPIWVVCCRWPAEAAS